jgi:hypothetical protein
MKFPLTSGVATLCVIISSPSPLDLFNCVVLLRETIEGAKQYFVGRPNYLHQPAPALYSRSEKQLPRNLEKEF